jgi:hypothetical protein
MTRSRYPSPTGVATPAEFISLVFAYLDLLAARWLAQARRRDPWERPVPVGALRQRGIHDGLLLWLRHQDQVVHLDRRLASPQRSPRPATTLLPTEASGFALTPQGERFADSFLHDVLLAPGLAPFQAAWDRLVLAPVLPQYDVDQRILHWGRHILKQYRQPSLNQEIVLATADELRWPPWFDDPLPRFLGMNPKVRLHNTVKALNRNQQNYFIHFKGDGTGTRIGWEYH